MTYVIDLLRHYPLNFLAGAWLLFWFVADCLPENRT